MKIEGKSYINLTPKSIDAFDDFMGLVEIENFRKNLRNLLFYYLTNGHQELAPEFGHFAEDMKFAFDFLDTLENEQKNE